MSTHALDFFAILAVPTARRDVPRRPEHETEPASQETREPSLRGGAFDVVELLQDGPEDTATNPRL